MTQFFQEYDQAVNALIKDVGKEIRIGIPLGIGKPIGFINALYIKAKNDPSIHLTIITALTLARPVFKTDLERRFVEPILDRLIGDYADPIYEKDRVMQTVPSNIKIIEFFLSPGAYLNNKYVQQNYISCSYSSVIENLIAFNLNAIAQQVAPKADNKDIFSLSCNSDLFLDVIDQFKQLNKPIAVIGESNKNLPFMLGEGALITNNQFDYLIDAGKYHSLFALPREELSIQDNLIGLYTSTLVKDDGCLQIGIGTLSNAVANALIYRQQQNAEYKKLLSILDFDAKFKNVQMQIGEVDVFSKGVYASTEMFSDEFLFLIEAGILKKKVYDHIELQKLLNAGVITEKLNSNILDVLIDNNIITSSISLDELQWLQHFGILDSKIEFKQHQLILANGNAIPNDLSASEVKAAIGSSIGTNLKNGKILHSGFFIGTQNFYKTLREMSAAQLQQLDMTYIKRTNTLDWSVELSKLQRKNMRFINASMMVTLGGVIISDGLQNLNEVSGVGGQFDFVDMAQNLPGSRSIIICRSTREVKNKVSSNIVWEFTNSTIPRFLRDIVVTEYGIADCRYKTDADVIKNMLNITDSRFQKKLLNQAKLAGKIENNYVIPQEYSNNYPKNLVNLVNNLKTNDFFNPYPFGSDLSKDEEQLKKVLLTMKNLTPSQIFLVLIKSFFKTNSLQALDIYLQRLNLQRVKTFKDWLTKQMVVYLLNKQFNN